MAQKKQLAPLVGWIYDLLLWIFSIVVDLFFREVHPRGSYKVPRRGPVIFVAAPHANQVFHHHTQSRSWLQIHLLTPWMKFVDSMILMRVIRMEAHRRLSFLIAEKSMNRKFIGTLARKMGALPVARALDSVKPGDGKIYLPDPLNEPTLVRGVGTKFDSPMFQVGGLIVLPTVNGQTPSTEIAEIRGPEELVLKKPFKTVEALKMITGRNDIDENGQFMNGVINNHEGFEGTKFKVAPHVDQTKIYDAVFERINRGGCIGIFPEGGSHDRPDLLPLKGMILPLTESIFCLFAEHHVAGLAIMALGALAANPDCGVTIVPCGMNYFHAHKFRSRAVVEFGAPIEVPSQLVELYKQGKRRQAVGSLLETVYQALVAVTVTSPDYDTLMVWTLSIQLNAFSLILLQLIQAARRLYNPTGKKLPLPMVVELNRRLVKGYQHYKDDPRIVNLKNAVNDYNKRLWLLGVRDHQVEYAKFPIIKVVSTLIYRLSKLAVMAIGTLPGLVLFAPVFVATKIISIKKSREALAASTVKLQGRDVMATWKLLVALALAPMLYALYTILLTSWTYRNRVQGYVPDWVPLWMVVIFGMIFFPSITFAALRIGETGMDIVKSLAPLVLSLNPTSANTLVKLRERRSKLSNEVTDLINTLGPEMFPDFDSARIVADPFRESTSLSRADSDRLNVNEPPTPSEVDPTAGDAFGTSPTTTGLQLPRNESFHNLANIGFFATRPPSRSRSRSSSTGGALDGGKGMPIKAFSSINSKESFDEVSKRIRGAMKVRRRRSEQEEESNGGSGSWDLAGNSSSGVATPGSIEGGK